MSELAYALYTRRTVDERYALRAVVFDPDHARRLVNQHWPLHHYTILRFVYVYAAVRTPETITEDDMEPGRLDLIV
jgi:hypothetical protein